MEQITEINPYEANSILHQYLIFHYANDEDQFSYPLGAKDGLNFPERCVSEGFDFGCLPQGGRALDLGCAVGRSTFELSRHFESVLGIDYSQSFIEAACSLKDDGFLPARSHSHGEKFDELNVHIPEEVECSKVHFEVGDAQDLSEDIGTFDAILGANLICRLPRPQALLERLPRIVKPGGQLVLTTPFTWLEEYTPRENWLGDTETDSFVELQSSLEPHFELQLKKDLPFLIREHARKFQYGVALMSRWIRKV